MASLLLTPGEGFRYKMCLEISQKLLGGVFLLLTGMYFFNENFLDEDSL